MEVPLQGIKRKTIAYKKTSGRTNEIPFFSAILLSKRPLLVFFLFPKGRRAEKAKQEASF